MAGPEAEGGGEGGVSKEVGGSGRQGVRGLEARGPGSLVGTTEAVVAAVPV